MADAGGQPLADQLLLEGLRFLGAVQPPLRSSDRTTARAMPTSVRELRPSGQDACDHSVIPTIYQHQASAPRYDRVDEIAHLVSPR
jgi:hypothetical protein